MKWWLCSDMTDFPLGKEGCQAQMEKIPKVLDSKKVRVRRGTLGGGEGLWEGQGLGKVLLSPTWRRCHSTW